MDSRATSPRGISRLARRAAVLLLGFGAAAALWSTPVGAAGTSLVNSSPAAGSSVATSPASITLTMSAAVGLQNHVGVTCGTPSVAAQTGTVAVSADKLTLTVPIVAPLPKGTCNVSWLVSAPDGSVGGTGSFSFTVASDTAVTTTVAAQTADTSPATTVAPASTGSATKPGGNTSGPLGLTRLFVALGLAVLFGSFVVIALAWPEGVEYILTVRFLRWAWLLSVAAVLANVICLTASLTGRSIGASVSPSAWKHLTDTTPGIAALVRLVATVATGWVVFRPERAIDQTTQLAALAVPGIAVATLGFSRSGGDLAALGGLIGAVHALGMAVWLGGLILLSRVVLAGPGEEDLVHAVRGFARISMPALWVTLFSGAIQTFRLDRGTLFSTRHGYVLLLKVAVVGVMVFVGVAARQFIRHRLAHAEAMTPHLAGRLRRALGIEAAVGVVVLVLTAWLLSLTPGNLRPGDPTLRGLGAQQRIVNEQVAGGIEVKIAFSQVVGPNAVRVQIVRPATGIANMTVDFKPPTGSTARSVRLFVPLTGTGVMLLPLDAPGLPLDAPGLWTLDVRVGNQEVGSINILVGNNTATSTPTQTSLVPQT